jgi:hypothetical protein
MACRGQGGRPGEGRHEELVFHGYRVSVWEEETALEMDGGDWLHSSVNTFRPLDYTLKIIKMVNFMLYVS